MRDDAIRIESLRKTYSGAKGQPEKQALKGIDLTIPRGSVFGLLGPNGAGKSTMINILAGLVRKTSGQVTIWGFDQDANPRQSRAAIGVMPQELNLDPFFTPRAALEVQAGLYGVPKQDRRSDEILEMVGLTDKAHAYARTLSGGMRRRLLLGKALVHHPHILVLDEPTAGVDIGLRQMLWENIRKLNKQGMTIILTTHYLEEAEEMCDEIAIINHGELIANKPTREMVDMAREKIVAVTVGSDLASPPSHDAFVKTELVGERGVEVTYNKDSLTAGQVLAILQERGLIVEDVTTREADLEDVFVSLTSRTEASDTKTKQL